MIQNYLNICDELNDPDSIPITDLDPAYLELARTEAAQAGLPWPPYVGLYDQLAFELSQPKEL